MAGAVNWSVQNQALLAAVYTSKQNSRIILLVKQAQGEPVELSRAWRGSGAANDNTILKARAISAALSFVAHLTRGPAPQVRSQCLTLVARAARLAAAR